MLKRLGNYPRQNGLAVALREVGRIERTLHTLDWLERPALRRQATVALNKGRVPQRARPCRLLPPARTPGATEPPKRSSTGPAALALVTAAIALWNTVYLTRALEAVRRRGEVIPDALLAHLAPLGWQHINLTGDYLWGAGTAFGPDGFRPLRGMSAEPLTAAA